MGIRSYFDYFDYVMGPEPRFRIYVDGMYLGGCDAIVPVPTPAEGKTTTYKPSGPCEVTFTVPKNQTYNWAQLLKQMHGRAKREDPEEQEKQAMSEKASTYYQRELWPLKLKALHVQSRHEHAIKKYRNDRSTHDGSMVVNRSLVVTMLEALANVMRMQKVRDIAGVKWDLHTVYMETKFDLGRSQGEEGGLLFPWDEPTARVPAALVIDLTTLYQHHVVQARDFPQGSTKGLPERLPESGDKKQPNKNGRVYKRTVTNVGAKF